MKKNGYAGNKNAAKEITADAFLHVRVKSDDKATWMQVAADQGLPLSQWIITTLNEQTKTYKSR